MAVKPSQWGADRLFARLDMPDSEYFPAITRQQAESLKTKYFTVRNAQNLYLAATKQVLAGEGVSAILYAGYCAFAGEMDRARRKLGAGQGLALEAATLVAKWVARGLSQSVLEKVRLQVFDVSAPVGP
ncbi:MAG TPA: hypothetical protein ENN51_01750 [candidate division WOR-3 bacterium]|uniref:Uncharacterized protein n=1 Tax=candidate division WOR-3 bacterium TaxID=2052148 RepID=A0A7V0T555_UNCW3|nr:hypothetical protein [candidate division WOR-3 bacterium]